MLQPLPLRPESHRPPLWSGARPPPPRPPPGSPVTHPCCRERVMLTATLAPSRKQWGPRPLPALGHPGQDCAALTAQLLDAKAPAVPRRGPGLRSPEAGWLGTFRDWLPWAPSLLQDWSGLVLAPWSPRAGPGAGAAVQS